MTNLYRLLRTLALGGLLVVAAQAHAQQVFRITRDPRRITDRTGA